MHTSTKWENARAYDLQPSYVCCSLQQTYEAKRQEFLVELQKREDEMRQMFVQRVKDKEAELKEAEREVYSAYMQTDVLTTHLKQCAFCPEFPILYI